MSDRRIFGVVCHARYDGLGCAVLKLNAKFQSARYSKYIHRTPASGPGVPRERTI